MMKVYIIDDEEQAREVMTYYLQEFFPEVAIIGSAADILKGGKEIVRLKPDLIFLDISMPHGSGFELLDRIDLSNSLFVFVSAHSQFALDAIKINIFDYLLKPLQLDELRRVILKAREHLDNRNDTIINVNKIHLRLERQTILVDPENILYINSDGNYSTIFLADGTDFMITKNIKKLEESSFRPPHFFRIHQSYIINIKMVKSYDSDKVRLDNGAEIPIAKLRLDEFKKLIARI